jgi:hypothetical protein
MQTGAQVWNGAKNLGNQAIGGVRNLAASEGLTGVKSLGTQAWGGAKNLGTQAVNGVKNWGAQAWSGAKDWGSKTLDRFRKPGNQGSNEGAIRDVSEQEAATVWGAGPQGKGTTPRSESEYDRVYPAATDKPKGMPLDMKQVREQYGEYGVKTVERTHQRADEIASAYRASKGDKGTSKPGPVLSGVTDPMTGKTYFGQNFKKGETKSPTFLKDLKEDLPEVLKQRLETHMQKVGAGEVKAENGKSLEMGGVPGSHAEIRALSQAIKAREALIGRPVTEAELPEFLMHNRNLLDKPVPAPEGVPPRCVHCWHLTDGVTVIGND